jgi:hypothetical protein
MKKQKLLSKLKKALHDKHAASLSKHGKLACNLEDDGEDRIPGLSLPKYKDECIKQVKKEL